MGIAVCVFAKILGETIFVIQRNARMKRKEAAQNAVL